jgi:uncharacterized protein
MSSGKSGFDQLPATIDPIQLAERGAHLAGSLPLHGMARLLPALLDDAGDVSVEISFQRGDNADLVVLHGSIRARVRVRCQRCLAPMDLDLVCEPRLVFMRGMTGDRDTGDADDVLDADRPVLVKELIEDELLLALPMIPMHELDACPARGYTVAGRGKKSPFAALQGREPDKD